MDQSYIISLHDVHGRKLANFLGLDDWTIHLYARPMADCCALCESRGEYRSATITIDPTAVHSEDEYLDILAHEMFHALLWPMVLIENVHHARMGNDGPSKAAASETFRQNNELMIANLMNLWRWYLRDAYLDRWTRP